MRWNISNFETESANVFVLPALTQHKLATAMLSRKQEIRYNFIKITTYRSASSSDVFILTIILTNKDLWSLKRCIFCVFGSHPRRTVREFVWKRRETTSKNWCQSGCLVHIRVRMTIHTCTKGLDQQGYQTLICLNWTKCVRYECALYHEGH